MAYIFTVALSFTACIYLMPRCTGVSVVHPVNGKLPDTLTFATKTTSTLDQCVRWCNALASCRSLAHNRMTRLCQLYSVPNVTMPSEFEHSNDWLHVTKEQWPQPVAGPCQNNTCGVTEMCVPSYTEGTSCFRVKATLHCSSSPCQSGICYETIDSFVCHCLPGFTGTLCDEDILECVSNPCLNAGTCNEHVNGYTCTCPPDYTGVHCETYTCTNFGNYRLCDGNGPGMASHYKGRLEYNNGGGTWGVLCDDYWPNQATGPIFDQNPVVACRTLGFSGGISRGQSFFGPGTGPFYLTSVKCTGSETALHNCLVDTSHTCGSGEHIGVECS